MFGKQKHIGNSSSFCQPVHEDAPHTHTAARGESMKTADIKTSQIKEVQSLFKVFCMSHLVQQSSKLDFD